MVKRNELLHEAVALFVQNPSWDSLDKLIACTLSCTRPLLPHKEATTPQGEAETQDDGAEVVHTDEYLAVLYHAFVSARVQQLPSAVHRLLSIAEEDELRYSHDNIRGQSVYSFARETLLTYFVVI